MIGIDIIRTRRFQKIKRGDFKHWNKYFTDSEWQHAFKKAASGESLAGIFVAKEAVFKCASIKEIATIGDIEIAHLKTGAPYVKVVGKKGKFNVSISHDGGFAIAVAIKR